MPCFEPILPILPYSCNGILVHTQTISSVQPVTTTHGLHGSICLGCGIFVSQCFFASSKEIVRGALWHLVELYRFELYGFDLGSFWLSYHLWGFEWPDGVSNGHTEKCDHLCLCFFVLVSEL